MRRSFVTCAKCAHWTEKTRETPVPKACGGCGAEFVKRASTTNAAWGNRGGRSLRFAFDPNTASKWKKDLPSAEVDSTGALVFRSESHQRKVFGEMRAAKEKFEITEAVAAEDRRRATGDPHPECPFDFGGPVPVTEPGIPVQGKPRRLRRSIGAKTNGR